MFFVVIFAAAFAIVPTILLSHRSSGPELVDIILVTFDTTKRLLPISLSSILDPQSVETDNTANMADLEKPNNNDTPNVEQDRLTRLLKQSCSALKPTYDSYSLEITRSEVGPASLYPLIKGLRMMQRNPLLGSTSHIPGERLRAALERSYQSAMVMSPSRPGTPRSSEFRRGRSPGIGMEPGIATPVLTRPVLLPSIQHFLINQDRSAVGGIPPSPSSPSLLRACSSLVGAITTSLQDLHNTVTLLLDPRAGQLDRECLVRKLEDARTRLESALAGLTSQLSSVLDDLNVARERSRSRHHGASSYSQGDLRRIALDPEGSVDRDHFRLAFYMTALLDLSKEILEILQVVDGIVDESMLGKKWWFPAIQWFWWKDTTDRKVGSPDKGSTSSAYFLTHCCISLTLDATDTQPVETELKAESDESALDGLDFVRSTLHRKHEHHIDETRTFTSKITHAWRNIWDRSDVVKGEGPRSDSY
jgi:hypothetical protein